MEALRRTSFKVKVTHFGKVRLEFTWKESIAGRLRWTSKNRAVVHSMIGMAMRFLEMCT